MHSKGSRICVFTGNRAEFGILLPLILDLSKSMQVDIFVSGAHLIKPWYTIREITKMLKLYKIKCNLIRFPIKAKTKNYYLDSFSSIYEAIMKYLIKKGQNQYALSICLGDRVETLAFANASFFAQLPILHLYGGDVVNVPYFDTNIRHALTKLSHIHCTSNAASTNIVRQLGEEEWRIENIGHLSFDYDRLKKLPSKNQLISEFKLDPNRFIFLVTWHPSQFKSSKENLEEFLIVLDSVKTFNDAQIILTYPNNDPGCELIMKKIKGMEKEPTSTINIIPNLGTVNLLGLMRNFKVIFIGNSSSGVFETTFFLTPAINIGDRQIDRPRGNNVFDLNIDPMEIKEKISFVLNHYKGLQTKFKKTQHIFGDGSAALKAKELISKFSSDSKDKLLYKKFIIKRV